MLGYLTSNKNILNVNWLISGCRFKSFVQQNPELWAPEPILAVQDIFVHRINVGQIIQSTELNYFQICCQESLDLLKSAAAK